MKTLTFNKQSWHYTIAKFGGFERWAEQDLCTYTRAFIMGIMQIAFCTAVIAIGGLILSHAILGIIFSIMTGTFMFTEIGFLTMIAISVILLIVGALVSIDKIQQHMNNRQDTPAGFIKNAYTAWKSKYCIKIDIRD